MANEHKPLGGDEMKQILESIARDETALAVSRVRAVALLRTFDGDRPQQQEAAAELDELKPRRLRRKVD